MNYKITTTAELHKVLSNITFGPSGVMLDKMDLKWEVEERRNGWWVRFTFMRPDTETGNMERGHGRWELLEYPTNETSIVKTCWILLELLVRHELMESFKYREVRVFDPHATIDTLYHANRGNR